jgi:hypothetical protein
MEKCLTGSWLIKFNLRAKPAWSCPHAFHPCTPERGGWKCSSVITVAWGSLPSRRHSVGGGEKEEEQKEKKKKHTNK